MPHKPRTLSERQKKKQIDWRAICVRLNGYMQSLHDSPTTYGRPTKYQDDFCDRVIECGKIGKSLSEIAEELDVTYETIRVWNKEIPLFSAAISRARELAQSWWERQGRENMFDSKESKFNEKLWAINVYNRFPETWRDRRSIEITGADGGPIELASVDQLRAELERRGKQSAIDVSAFTDVEVVE